VLAQHRSGEAGRCEGGAARSGASCGSIVSQEGGCAGRCLQRGGGHGRRRPMPPVAAEIKVVPASSFAAELPPGPAHTARSWGSGLEALRTSGPNRAGSGGPDPAPVRGQERAATTGI